MMTTRVLQCPINIAGQAAAFRDGLRQIGVKADVWTLDPSPFSYSEDRCLNLLRARSRRVRGRRRRIAAAKAALHYDVMHFHFGSTFFPNAGDIPLYRFAKRKMLMSYWGSDVRLYSLASRRNPYFALMGEDPGLEARRREGMVRLGSRIPLATVPDAELREYVAPFFDRVEVMPVALHVHDVHPTFARETDEPLVVHVPSNRRVKGTAYVLEEVERLRARGVRFRFEMIENVSNDDARAMIARSDIVIDQLLLGVCGLVGLEAMACGKPVLTYVREDLRSTYPPAFPAVCVTKDSVADSLAELFSDAARRQELGEAGRRYVERNHSPELRGRQLLDLYASL